MLITHNLKAAWRNILKYKVQNTISVLCLSVGVLLFGITLYFTNILWENQGKQLFQSDRVYCRFYQDNTLSPIGVNEGLKEMERINQLPSVEKLIYISRYLHTDINFYDSLGNARSGEMQYKIVSPDWLADNNYRSIANDKKIGVLKPGTIVYNSPRRNQEDSNWIGATISCLGKKHKITDVVYSTTSFDECTQFYIVADKNATYYNFSTYDLNCIVKKGHTKEEFISELKKLYPDYKIKWNQDYKENRIMVVIVIFCLMLLGSSVLIIGMSGYLKMQLQLFLLRSREMALRRCNGAKPFQLFMLLCYELLIVFGFTAVISILISIALADYSLPLIQKFGFSSTIYPLFIYETELYIVIVTLLCAIGIAWLVVRKTLKSPLSQTVGRSFTQRTLWNGTMQVVQYLVTIILFFAIIFTFTSMSEANGEYKKDIDPNYFKNVLLVNLPISTDSWKKLNKEAIELPSIEKKAFYRFIHASILIKEDSISNSIKHVQDDSTRYFYGYVIDTEYLSMFKHDITEKIDSGEIIRSTPVFASKEEVDSIKHLLSLKYSTSDEETILPDGNKYVRIGYTDPISPIDRYYNYNSTHFYIIKNVEKYSSNGENVKAKVDDCDIRMYVIPKNNDVDLFKKEYDALWHKYWPDAPSDFHYPVNSVYDLDFIDDQIIRFVGELISILTAVSILCIILTVYSSISLETRGKQKEVAIRKVNGAKTRDIVMLFSRYYIITLCTAFVLSLLIGVALIVAISITVSELERKAISIIFQEIITPITTCYLVSIATITLVTLLTVWQKIYKISHINPALLIKKE